MARKGAQDASFATIARWLGAVVALLLAWAAAKIILLLFSAVLLALLLRGAADRFASVSEVSEGPALAAVGLVALVILASTAALLAPELSTQLDQLSERIPHAWSDLMARAARFEWGRRLLSPTPPNPTESMALISNAGVVLGATVQSLAHFMVFLLAGIYLAIDPDPYVSAALWLAPDERREETRRILGRIGRVLRAWLLSRAAAMAIVAVLTTLGLWALGVQLALTLGLAAGVMTFVPYVGAFASAAPALLLGFVQSPPLAAYIMLLYVAVHVLEGYVVTPLIEQEAIRLPPAASIAAQAILGTVLGLLGLILASPLTAAAIVVLQSLSTKKDAVKAA